MPALNSFSSIEDLIFTSTKFSHRIRSSFIFISKVLSFAKLNLSILYPKLYERTVWFYEKPDAELIRRAIK